MSHSGLGENTWTYLEGDRLGRDGMKVQRDGWSLCSTPMQMSGYYTWNGRQGEEGLRYPNLFEKLVKSREPSLLSLNRIPIPGVDSIFLLASFSYFQRREDTLQEGEKIR